MKIIRPILPGIGNKGRDRGGWVRRRKITPVPS